jgi:large subunit ribosomal protein L1
MVHISKKDKVISSKVELRKYGVEEAVSLLSSLPQAKFIERFDLVVMLGVDARKSDQAVRGSSILPKGSGKNMRVAVYAQGALVDELKAAGADVVGSDELVASIQKGKIDFDILLASPMDMAKLGRLGTILGPRGLMPNPKVGSVTKDLVTAVGNFKSKQVRYKTDKNGIVHCPVGNLKFSAGDIKENIVMVIEDLKKFKPATTKGIYLKKISLSTTMGPGVELDIASLAS